MPLSHLIFDLDDTLYPAANGLWNKIRERIAAFMVKRLGIDAAQANQLRQQYYLTHGTALCGLLADYPTFNPDEFLAYVHDIDLQCYIVPNPALDAMLTTLPQPKAIFTNADAAHARRVLTQLGIARHFPTIVDIRAMNFESKPRPPAYQALLRMIGAPAGECLYVEDSVWNLRPAKALGFITLLVGNGHDPDPAIDYRVGSILEIEDLIQNVMRNP